MVKHGGFQKGRPDMTDADYMAKWKGQCIINEDGCWLWQGWVRVNGYGETTYRGKNGRLHRWTYQLHRGSPAPAGWDVCHTCTHRNCINPLHLFAASRAANIQDMVARGRGNNQQKTHCKQGHPYSGANLWVDSRNFRHCRECNRVRLRLAWANGDGKAKARQKAWRDSQRTAPTKSGDGG